MVFVIFSFVIFSFVIIATTTTTSSSTIILLPTGYASWLPPPSPRQHYSSHLTFDASSHRLVVGLVSGDLIRHDNKTKSGLDECCAAMLLWRERFVAFILRFFRNHAVGNMMMAALRYHDYGR